MNPQPRITVNAVALIAPSNAPILVHAYRPHPAPLKYHFVAHTALDIIDERLAKGFDCYLGLLHTLEDQAVYGYVTPTRVRIVISLALTDTLVRDADVITIFKSLHSAYARSLTNPFLTRTHAGNVALSLASTTNLSHSSDPSSALIGSKALKRHIIDIGRAIGIEESN